MKDRGVLERIEKLASRAGKEVLLAALTLWFCLKDSQTPVRVKALILGDLAYLISPLDAIPDVIPALGFSDDMGLMAATLVAVSMHVKPAHREKAQEKLSEWTTGA